ncbi:alpha/beta fold hydrolase [Trifolium pratense]|uniref:Alpha/beta fold hydrolase n=1 Tax=Trifolium pratense TaxID=57577 RepID=A0A2K3P1K1_TRIPR|nr:alpha/beta fold hydrolase [Trifolium pratense]
MYISPLFRWLVSHLMGLGYSKTLADWIGTNLKKVGDHETWIFDLQSAKEMFHSYWEKSYWDLLENPPQGMEIVIVRAEKSDRWDEEAIERIQKLASQGGTDSVGKVSFCVLPNAGHWVHVDNPKGLLEIVASKMASL